MGNISTSFRDYVKNTHKSGAVERDFVAEAKRDRSFPNFKSWMELRSHLLRREDAHVALVAGRAVWQGYRKHLEGRQTSLVRAER